MKAQIWSTDFVMSAVIFLLALGLILFAWNYTSTSISQRNELGSAENIAMMVSDALIRTPGIPENWNSSTVISPGLASRENVLDSTKVDAFINMSYEYTKTLLGLERYHFCFRLLDPNGSLMQNEHGQNLTIGQHPENSQLVIPVQRYVLYNGKPAKMDFILWA